MGGDPPEQGELFNSLVWHWGKNQTTPGVPTPLIVAGVIHGGRDKSTTDYKYYVPGSP